MLKDLRRHIMMQQAGGGGDYPPTGWHIVASIFLERRYYIDTDYTPNSETTATFKGCVHGTNTAIFGSRGPGNTNRFDLFSYDTNNRLYAAYNATNYYSTVPFGEIKTFVIDKNMYYIDDALMHTFTYGEFISPATIIFGISRMIKDGMEYNYVVNSGGVTIVECKFAENGDTKRHYIPVVSDDGTQYGLWEKVTGQICLPRFR